MIGMEMYCVVRKLIEVIGKGGMNGIRQVQRWYCTVLVLIRYNAKETEESGKCHT